MEEESHMTIYEKLDANNRFEPVMADFIDKMSKDKILGHFFHNNHKMKHCIPNKIVLFFTYTKGEMNNDDVQSMKDIHKKMRVSIFDFERSIILFKESLYENNIDSNLVSETLNFYKKMKKDIVYNEEDEKIFAAAEDYHNTHRQKN